MRLLPPAGGTATRSTGEGKQGRKGEKTPLVEFEMMTWPEVKDALAAGKTTASIYTGGTEQRGPQNVNGGHNLMGRETVKAIALRLGNAIALPVLPYSPNRASATLPGTIGLTNEILAIVLERITEEAIVTGFRNVILMGDHGGGSRTSIWTSRRSWTTNTVRRAPTSIIATTCIRRRWRTSTSGSPTTATRAARTPAFPTRPSASSLQAAGSGVLKN
jgi:hypothetical protein